jgi:hypothetical protein
MALSDPLAAGGRYRGLGNGNSVERDPGKVLQEDLPGSSPQLLVAAVSITVQGGATVGLSALGVSNRGARRHTMREPRIQRNLRPNAEFSPSTLRIIVSPGNCTLSWMRRTHCRASHLATCGHTVLPKIGPVIALHRRTDYQFSPNWLSGAEASVQMRSRFAIIGRSVAGKAICHSATRWLPALSLTFINPPSVVLGYGFPGET